MRVIPALLLALACLASYRVGVLANVRGVTVALSSGELVCWRTGGASEWLYLFDSHADPLDGAFIAREQGGVTRALGFAWGRGVVVVPGWVGVMACVLPVRWRREVRGFEVQRLPTRGLI